MAFMAPVGAFLSSASGAIAAASAAVGALGAIQQGRQASAAAQSAANQAEYQGKIANIRQNQINTNAGLQEDEQRRKARAVIGQQLASSAEAGAGLNSDLLRESIYGMEADSNAIRYDAALKSSGLSDEAALQKSNADIYRSRAKEARGASYLNAASSLLQAGTSYYGGKPLNPGAV